MFHFGKLAKLNRLFKITQHFSQVILIAKDLTNTTDAKSFDLIDYADVFDIIKYACSQWCIILLRSRTSFSGLGD